MNIKDIPSVIDSFYKTGNLSISIEELRAFFQKLAKMLNFIEDEEERKKMQDYLSRKYLKTANTFLCVSILHELDLPLSGRKNFRFAIEFVDLYKASPGAQPIIVVSDKGRFYWDFAKRYFLETCSEYPQLIEIHDPEKEIPLSDDPEKSEPTSDEVNEKKYLLSDRAKMLLVMMLACT